MTEILVGIILILGFLTALLLSSRSKARVISKIADNSCADWVVEKKETRWLEGLASLSLTSRNRKAWLSLLGLGQPMLELQVAGDLQVEFRVLSRRWHIASILRAKRAIKSDLYVVIVPVSSTVSLVERTLDTGQVGALLGELWSLSTLKYIVVRPSGVSVHSVMPLWQAEREEIVRRKLDLVIRLVEELEDVCLEVDH